MVSLGRREQFSKAPKKTMKRFERDHPVTSPFHDDIVTRYDAPTIHSRFSERKCSGLETKIPFSVFETRVKEKGVDTIKYRGIVQQAYNNITPNDKNGRHALDTAVLNSSWRERASVVVSSRTDRTTLSMQYERRENGNEDVPGEDVRRPGLG